MSHPLYANNVKYPSIAEFLRTIGVPRPSRKAKTSKLQRALEDDGIFVYKKMTYILRSHERRSIVPPTVVREIVTKREHNAPPILLKKHQTIGLHQDRGEHYK